MLGNNMQREVRNQYMKVTILQLIDSLAFLATVTMLAYFLF